MEELLKRKDAIDAIECLKVTFYIFEFNYKQLKEWLISCGNNMFAEFENSENQSIGRVINLHLDETSRLLHNFFLELKL